MYNKQLEGCVDTSNDEIAISPTLYNVNIGTYYGNLKEGLNIKVDGVMGAKGTIKLYGKDQAVWVNIQLTSSFGGPPVNQEAKLFSY